MIPQLILAILIGILAGTLTGLIPGIHINLVSVIIIGFFHAVSLSPNPLLLVIFIVSMATAHTFLDFIPSIYLGAPD